MKVERGVWGERPRGRRVVGERVFWRRGVLLRRRRTGFMTGVSVGGSVFATGWHGYSFSAGEMSSVSEEPIDAFREDVWVVEATAISCQSARLVLRMLMKMTFEGGRRLYKAEAKIHEPRSCVFCCL